MKAKIEEVCGVKVFKGISDDSLNRILVCGDIVDLKKNACLYHDRQDLYYVYFLLKGKVTLVKPNENGESKVVFILNPGDTINQPVMRNNTSAVECWGFENSRILRIGFDDFDTIMAKDYILAKNCMAFMENRIRRLYRQLKNSVTINIEKRLAAKLVRLGLDYGSREEDSVMTRIDLNLTVTYIAKMLGCQRESVSRAMKSLTKRGIVELDGRKIYVDIEKARKFFKS
ncbi:Crp/Fnr family transcriptional regulator [Peptostreptococcus stomatis]|uniref:Crp/Fnr family transcriptional regulator n=1 Tax=Peptostreptococcus stomatis TaxID=341694 RepID=UPI001A419D1C|nr:Crp/Fnr family transcriptional regulator [Peptostreptococcus stomatis]MBL6465780.1 Crp/Fnr family transcriptional regulator [Peptostreptococcus stomatis]